MNYNQRTAKAVARRLRWILDPLNEDRCPAALELRWRFQEGYRLQCMGEVHEPGGQGIMDANNRLGMERMLGAIEAMQDTQSVDDLAYTAIQRIIDRIPAEIGVEGLKVIADDERAPAPLRKNAAQAAIDLKP